MKKKLRLLSILLIISLLSACAFKKQGEYLSDEEVVKEIEKVTGTEHVSILGKEEKSGYFLYTFKTNKRELVFTATSYPAGDSGIYNPASVSQTEYVQAVHALYDERIQAILDEVYKGESSAIFANRSELREIVKQIENMDEIYREELEYHDEKWLKEHWVTVVSLSRRETGETEGDFSYGVRVDGTIHADELEQYICDLYEERTGKVLDY